MMPVAVPASAGVTPLQGQWNAVGNGQQPPAGTIPLHTVIDYILQKTYHDIVVLADLLPGKSDLERKIDIAHFANRTRQLVIRLLTVVKWAGSVSKVMKCQVITQLLDQQGFLFVDTADKLHTLANQFVVQARLPNFTVPAAIDVLTTGSYPRLPKAIRDKIIPPDPITPLEKSITLKRLDEIICHRLAVTKIPLQITDITVDKGMVKLTVPGEFKAILTLMDQSDDIPWRLLKIDIAVEDQRVGSGKALVHPLQVEYVHKLLQSRLLTNEAPMQDLYDVLHSFCLSLKIEVLEAQAHRLLRQRWGRLIQIDEYQPGNKVVLSYWRTSISKLAKPDPMTISIHLEKKNDSIALEVSHKPPLILEKVDLLEKASSINDLSLERLLGDTISVRSYHKLYAVLQLLKKHLKNNSSYVTNNNTSLVIPLAKSFRSCGNMYLSVDPQTGAYVCASMEISQDTLYEVEQSTNEAIMKLVTWIPKLKLILARQHCRATLQNLPAFIVEKPPLTNTSTHAVGKLGDDVIYIKFAHYDTFYMVVQTLHDDQGNLTTMHKYHLLKVVQDDTNQTLGTEKAGDMVEINSSLFEELDDSDGDMQEFQNSELALIVAACFSRLPYIDLIQDLGKEGFLYQGLLVDSNTGLSVKLLDLDILQNGDLPENKSLLSNTLQCSFRFRLLEKASKSSDAVGIRVWYTEFVFTNNPLKVESKRGAVTRLTIKLDMPNSESPVMAFKDIWMSINKLYVLVAQFADVLYDNESTLGDLVSVYSYDYQSLVLKYGARRCYTVSVNWSFQNQAFVLHFGRVGSAGFNSHTHASHYLTAMFNNGTDLGKLVQVLHDTSGPLQIACSISSFPVIGMVMGPQYAKHICNNFMVLVQSPWRFLLIYRSVFALEVCCMTNRRVSIRDGAMSKCDSYVVKGGFQPIPGLINFLTLICESPLYFGPASNREDPPMVEQNSKTLHGVEVKTIPHGNWTGNAPVVLHHADFVKLLREQRVNSQSTPSILEQFLGLSSLKANMARGTQIADNRYFPQIVQNPCPSEISNFQYAVNSLLIRCSLQLNGNSVTLVLKLQQVPSFILQERGVSIDSWHTDNFHTLERFFQLRVATHPYRPNNMAGFCTIIAAKAHILSDFINIMRLEFTDHQTDPSVRWQPQLCLTIPPRLAIAAPCAPAVYIKDKILIVVLFSPKNISGSPVSRQSVAVPIVLHSNGNILIPPGKNNPHHARMEMLVKQYMDSRPPHATRSHLANVVKYFMDNYIVQ